MEKKKGKPVNDQNRNDVRMIAENSVAVQIARQILDSAPVQEMEKDEKAEFQKIKKIVNFAADLFESPDIEADDPELGAAAQSWNAFLHLFMREILDNPADVKRRIENVFDEMIEEMESGGE